MPDTDKTMSETERLPTLEELDALAEKERAATKGPWFATDSSDSGDKLGRKFDDGTGERAEADDWWTVSSDPAIAGWETDSGYPGYGILERDAQLIAALRNAASSLLAAARLGVQARAFADEYGAFADYAAVAGVLGIVQTPERRASWEQAHRALQRLLHVARTPETDPAMFASLPTPAEAEGGKDGSGE